MSGKYNTVKNIFLILCVFAFVFQCFMCGMWCYCCRCFKPYGNETVSLKDIIFVEDYTATDELFSDNAIYVFLKKSSFKSVGMIEKNRIWRHYKENEYTHVFGSIGSDNTIVITKDKKRFLVDTVIKHSGDLYIQCSYSVVEDKIDRPVSNAYHTMYKVIPMEGDEIPAIEDDYYMTESNTQFLYLTELFLPTENIIYYIHLTGLKYCILVYWLFGIIVSICIPLIKLRKNNRKPL